MRGTWGAWGNQKGINSRIGKRDERTTRSASLIDKRAPGKFLIQVLKRKTKTNTGLRMEITLPNIKGESETNAPVRKGVGNDQTDLGGGRVGKQVQKLSWVERTEKRAVGKKIKT